MAWTKAKTAEVIGAGLLLAAGTVTVTVKEVIERQGKCGVIHSACPWFPCEGVGYFQLVRVELAV